MESTNFIMHLLQQNQRLLEENIQLHAQLAKLTPQVVVSKKQEKQEKPKHPSHIKAGKNVSILNKIRKEFIESAKANSEEEW